MLMLRITVSKKITEALENTIELNWILYLNIKLYNLSIYLVCSDVCASGALVLEDWQCGENYSFIDCFYSLIELSLLNVHFLNF